METGQICTKGHFYTRGHFCTRVKKNIIKKSYRPRVEVRGNSGVKNNN